MNHAKRLGVKVGLGTDVAGGYSPSMLNALRSAVITSKALRMQHLAPTEHGTEPSPANSHLLDYKVSGDGTAARRQWLPARTSGVASFLHGGCAAMLRVRRKSCS